MNTNAHSLAPLWGDRHVTVLAGPCSAESREQTLATATALARAGVQVFRAGVWKPRTKPGGFEGMGEPALRWLRDVKRRTGMAVATEVASAAHLRLCMLAGIDAVWLGARTVANPFAVQEIADAFAAMPPQARNAVAVMVKNPVNPDIELWIGAIERLLAAGVTRLAAIHRGFSSYGEQYYRNAPMWRIPIELHRRWPELPLYCDPSHIGGKRRLVAPLAQTAMDMKFDGLIIECHCNPEQALSDSAQQITPAELAALLENLRTNTRANTGDIVLEECRRTIDNIDDELMELIARRMQVSREIGRIKNENAMPVVQPQRYRQLIEKRLAEACHLKLDPAFVRQFLAVLHEESVRQQIERLDSSADNF